MALKKTTTITKNTVCQGLPAKNRIKRDSERVQKNSLQDEKKIKTCLEKPTS